MCQQISGNAQIFLALDWDGRSHELFRVNAVPPVVLSPDGQRAAGETGAEHRISIFSGGNAVPTAAIGTPAGWFDSNHVLFMTGISGPCCQPLTSAAVLDLISNMITPVGPGLTGSGDPFAPFFVPIPSSLV